MSFCQEDGKDKYVFLTSDEANEPSKLSVPEEIDRPENFVKGFVDKDGNLNWECACRGSMVASKCGLESRTFLQCIHKNMDKSDKFEICIDPLIEMQKCMNKHPKQYPKHEDQKDSDDTNTSS
ncbi:mitochondrial intermembrane space import and assembly protein 40-A-like isoform X2 [Pecten maximus]|uniref:mitochondrial intermembrane space import and assembly protein 40-A-like isoform X2 n=1 Tax=Pecten maximus TaxID=6579 RepID=UPI0014582A4B|nr:mitochondrial intermembrane space import and assembly protein 40-A-like isoform X2 [Pecten maximus]